MRSHALEPLEAALHLARLAGLGAEARRRSSRMWRDLALLARERRRLRSASAARCISKVASSCRRRRARRPASMCTMRADDAVEELAVVRDQQQRAAVGAAASPRATAPHRGRGGWSARRAAAGRSGASARVRGWRARCSPPENSRTGRSRSPRREAQARRRAAPRGCARRSRRARSYSACSAPRERRRAPRSRAICASSARSSQVAVEHVFDQRAGASGNVLGDGRDAPVRAARCSRRHRRELAADQLEQSRLAAAVAADDADLLAAKMLQVAPSKQHLRAAPQADVWKGEHRRRQAEQGFADVPPR